ncbi:MAG: RagB/SusD family nutrient uptake outer membrane protein [Bacteroidetes bacterium]|uniref:RagB/SusD family nutrient uptake outer membrane protein n=1 Tax=Candidatus Cryptobacteroides excrementipullorum TaxID=2840761 RepID=A0A9D9NKZ3_9BACT|nr:RagB/SusD family nutrient uptake outer membrane protein [Candidatus Cryptobacteroides excrementipullorum]
MKKLTIYILAVLSLTSCLNLDKFPLDSMSPDTFFSSDEELQAFSNKFYTMLPATSLYTDNADTYTQNKLPDEISGLRIVPASGGGWSWGDLRDVNTLLEYSVNCKDEEVRVKYDALARFFRAYFYFDKVKRFGDVPWYDKQLASDDPDLYKPRDSREYVMQKMIEDIDYAIENLGSGKDLYRITKWSALALKSRFCLFEGTFRKYHGIELDGHDWRWYLEQAAAAAEQLIDESGYSLYTADGPDKSYMNLFASENAIQTEVILARDYNQALGVFHNSNYFSIGQTNGQPGMTRKLVASYLMADGTRFTDKPGWETMQFAEECKDRDPRLAQSIRTPGYMRIGGSTTLLPDFSGSVTGYQQIKYVTGTDCDSYNISYNDLIIFRMGEVYLNFAEALAELGTLTQEDLDKSINRLRSRAGMPDMNKDEANANPDPYLMSPETGYPGVEGPDMGVILEIRRERTVELAQEGFRYYDIVRWKEGQAFNRQFYGMYFPGPGEYDLDGDGTMDLYLWKDHQGSTTASVEYEISKDIFLSDGDSGYVTPHPEKQEKWVEERDYYYPIPIDDRSLTGGVLTQNPGWDDGLVF